MGNHKCDLCEKTFQYKSHLNKHKDGVHTDTKVYICDICTKSFIHQFKRDKHIESVHGDDIRHFVCEKCEKSFKQQSQLNRAYF